MQADRLLQAGRTETAVFELKRVLGMKADATLTVRDTFEALVQRESAVAPQVRDMSTTVEQRADVREAAARIDTAVAKIDRAESKAASTSASSPTCAWTPASRSVGSRRTAGSSACGAVQLLVCRRDAHDSHLNRNQGEVAVARAERTGAAAAYDAARLAAEAELASARARDERAREAVKIYGAGAQALARQNLTVVGQSYELGRVTVFEVLAERRRYLDVERAYTEALRAAHEARTALKRALGENR